jgi:hypothetical protein
VQRKHHKTRGKRDVEDAGFFCLPSSYLTVCHGRSPLLRTVNHL